MPSSTRSVCDCIAHCIGCRKAQESLHIPTTRVGDQRGYSTGQPHHCTTNNFSMVSSEKRRLYLPRRITNNNRVRADGSCNNCICPNNSPIANNTSRQYCYSAANPHIRTDNHIPLYLLGSRPCMPQACQTLSETGTSTPNPIDDCRQGGS